MQKKIDIKIRAYYFFDDMISIKNLDQNKIKIQKSYKNILIYYIRYNK